MHQSHLEVLCTTHRNSGTHLCIFSIEGFSLSFTLATQTTQVENVLKQKRLISVRLLEAGHFENPMKHPYPLWHLNSSELLTLYQFYLSCLGDLMQVPRAELMTEPWPGCMPSWGQCWLVSDDLKHSKIFLVCFICNKHHCQTELLGSS